MHAQISRRVPSASLLGCLVVLWGCETVELTNPAPPPPPAPVVTVSPPPPAPPPAPTWADTVVNGNVWNLAMENRRAALASAAAGTSVAVSQNSKNELVVVIPSDLAFAPHSATIGPAIHPILDTLASSLAKLMDIQLSISAHTDNVASDPQNNTLSLERARSVRSYLISKRVVTPFIQAVGRGSRDPMASNETTAGRTRNRRVEIVVRQTAN